ncbi:RcnB family protein [Sphingomonas sp.]|uniref:RcnB family protein n=1 Tax=Sphingomonas sp. TaxID=28214 RepID=UPI0028AA315E|nr:RcnB family protein [Sphingomonas sp.]
MKRMLLAAIAAATALVPAAAIAQERGEHRGNGGWMRPDNFRPQGGQGGQGWQRQQGTPQAQPQAQPQDRGNWQRPQGQPQDRGNWQRPQGNPGWQRPQGAPQAMDRGEWRRPDGQPRPAFQQPQGTQNPAQPQRDWRGGQRPDWQNRGDVRNPQAWQDRRWDDRSRGQWNGARDWDRRDGNRGWNDRRDWDRGGRWRGDRGVWNNGWRNDNRYDWRGYRDYNRSLYRLPRYYPPARWSYGYRRFSVGYRLDSFLFAQQYWISDPYAYRLPEVWGPYRWVRYYDDALLVDVDSGQVVDVIYGIFW